MSPTEQTERDVDLDEIDEVRNGEEPGQPRREVSRATSPRSPGLTLTPGGRSSRSARFADGGPRNLETLAYRLQTARQ